MRPLASDALSIVGPHWDSLGYLIVLCHGEPAILGFYVWPLHTLLQFIDKVDIGVGQFIALVLAQVVAGLVSLPSFPIHATLGELSSTVLASSSNVAGSSEQGQFS